MCAPRHIGILDRPLENKRNSVNHCNNPCDFLQYPPALSDVASVLLGVGGRPAAELGEVAERRVVVVVGVPQRQGVAVRVAGGAEDGRPLGGRGVHAALDTIGGARVDQALCV